MRLALLTAAPIALLIALLAATSTSCGAVTLETQPPEEPLPDAAPRPRLLRPDADGPP